MLLACAGVLGAGASSTILRAKASTPRWSTPASPAAAARARRAARARWAAGAQQRGAGVQMLDDGEPTELQQHVDLLNSCFKADTREPHYSSPSPSPPTAEQAAVAPTGAHLFPNLPLWRVQWVTLPHHNELLNVHVPHYCHMFSEIMSRERPWLFGSLFLEGGSRNLGAEGQDARPGDVGTLCEIVTCQRQTDGRMLLGIRAVGRIEVLRETQSLPYARADCEFYTDEEELELLDDMATEAVASLATDDTPLARITGAVNAATLAAASTMACEWAALEATLPVASGEGIPALSAIDVASADELEQARARISVAAVAAASKAAESALGEFAMGVDARLGPPVEASPFVLDEEDELADEPESHDTWRGAQPGEEDEDADADAPEEVAAAAEAAAEEELSLASVEASCWNELLATWTLAGRLRALKLGDLPPMLTSLMPPPPPGGWDECPGEMDDEGVCLTTAVTLPGPVRRTRASFLLTALLPELVKTVEQRLELLRSRSVHSRLLLLRSELVKQRKVLAAVLALRGAMGPTGAAGTAELNAAEDDGGEGGAEDEPPQRDASSESSDH